MKEQQSFGVLESDRFGLDVRVTGLERTLVDVLNRPDLAGSWEEIWQSLESVEFFDLDKVLEYVFLLENATTAAKEKAPDSIQTPFLLFSYKNLLPLNKYKNHHLFYSYFTYHRWVDLTIVFQFTCLFKDISKSLTRRYIATVERVITCGYIMIHRVVVVP